MRILALDYGSKTVGLAITDPLGIIVQPLKTIWREREGKLRKTVEEIQETCKEYQVEELVLGYPCHMDGSEGERVERVLAFQEMLKNQVAAQVILEDYLRNREEG